jgi:membrane protease YdiL (CAAX protease family)
LKKTKIYKKLLTWGLPPPLKSKTAADLPAVRFYFDGGHMKNAPMKYVIFTYLFFWAFIGVIGLFLMVLKLDETASILQIISAWSPTIVILIMFGRLYRNVKLLPFLKRQFSEKIKISAVLWIIAVLGFTCVGTLLYFNITDNLPLQKLLIAPGAIGALLFKSIITGATGEELGWRGYLLNSLREKYSPLKAAIIVGIVWSFWHLPLWFLSGYSGWEIVAYGALFTISLTSASVLITMFYSLSHNLLIPILIHFLMNFLMGLVSLEQSIESFVVTTVFYFAAAVIAILVNYKKILYGPTARVPFITSSEGGNI